MGTLEEIESILACVGIIDEGGTVN